MLCRIYCQFIFRILNKDITKKDMDIMLDNTMYYNYKNEEVQPTASAYDSIVTMLHAFMNTDNFEDAIITAVNYGGDSDTIGADHWWISWLFLWLRCYSNTLY